MRFQHAKKRRKKKSAKGPFRWTFLKSYRDSSDLHIVSDHIISTSPSCFLHKCGGLSVAIAAALWPLSEVPLPSLCQPPLCSHFFFSTSGDTTPSSSTSLIPPPVILSASFFFIALVLVFCHSTPEGETTKGRVSMASPPATRLVSLLLSFLPLFFPPRLLFFYTARFDLRVKELLIHCRARDLRGCRRLKRNCIFNRVRVCVCVRMRAPAL